MHAVALKGRAPVVAVTPGILLVQWLVELALGESGEAGQTLQNEHFAVTPVRAQLHLHTFALIADMTKPGGP